MPEAYPERPAERDRWILARRAARNALDPRRPYAYLVEDERAEDGAVVPVATVFLTNQECPWRCLMCDLWQNTLTEKLPPGAIPEQIDHALAHLAPARQIKLYNSGSFFDSQAIPVEDYEAIARRVAGFERVVVESHPWKPSIPRQSHRDFQSRRMQQVPQMDAAGSHERRPFQRRMDSEPLLRYPWRQSTPTFQRRTGTS